MAIEKSNPISNESTAGQVVQIGQPQSGTQQVIEVKAGETYQFDFDGASVRSIEHKGGDLVITFDNGSSVILENYASAQGFDLKEGLTLQSGDVLMITEANTQEPENVANQDGLQPAQAEEETSVMEELKQEIEEAQASIEEKDAKGDQPIQDQAEQLAKTEPASGDIAQRLAQVEPAAGEGTGAIGSQGRGYGFESSFTAQGVIPISDVGPIDPTALVYNIPQVKEDLGLQVDQPLPPIDPIANFSNSQVLEDGSVQILIQAVPVTEQGILTFTISGIPADWTVTGADGVYNPATGTWTLTTTSGSSFNGGPILSPPADSDIDLSRLSVSVTEVDPVSGREGSASSTITVVVDAVADTPDVDANNVAGMEGHGIALDVPTALTGEEVNNGLGGDDGSETIESIVISGGTGVDLNDYTFSNANGMLSVDAATGTLILGGRHDLTGLTITPKDPNFVGTINLNVTINTVDGPSDFDFDTTNNTASDTDSFSVTWKPVANPPEVNVDTHNTVDADKALVLEDGSVSVDVSGTLDVHGSGNEILTLTVTGIDLTKLEGGAAGFVATNGPDGEVWTRVAGSPDNNASYTITLHNGGENYTGTFTFTPDAQSDLDITDMVVKASAYEPATSTSADSAPDSFDVIVDAVADPLDLHVSDAKGNEGTTLDIVITNALTGEDIIAGGEGLSDGSESIVNIVISSSVDLQNDFIVTNTNGTVTFDTSGNIVFTDPSDLDGLKITPKDSNFSGDVNLAVVLNTTEAPVSDSDFDNTNNTAYDLETICLTWNPTIDPPSILVNGGVEDAQVKEDGSVDVEVEAALASSASPAEYLTLTVSGIDLTKLDSFTANGWTRTDDGSANTNATYQITLAPGQSYSGIFTFVPAANSDLDLTNMVVTATSTDSSVSPAISASANDSFNVIVDAVADAPSVVADDNSGEEGASLSVNIDGLLGADKDGSESISGYEVRGDATEMTNFTFTVNGVVQNTTGGVIYLSAADVDNLVVTPKDSTWVGSITLSAVVLNAEGAVAGAGEYDTSDNTNSASDPFTLTWIDDDEPVITQPETVSVKEVDLTGTPESTSVTDKINVDFGDDGTGATIKGNGTFDVGGATSNGDPIVVTFDQTTGTYTGTADGKDVFTLVIENDGDYTFTLLGTVDHPDTTDPDDSLPFTFGFTATDSDGDKGNGVITVNIIDDAPVAHNDIVSRSDDFDTLNGNVITGAGNTVAGGADDLSQDDSNTVTKVNGVSVSATGTTDVAGTYGTLHIKADGSYTYTLNAGQSSEDVKEVFTYTLKDGDGDTSQAKLTIEGLYDSVPTNVKTEALSVDETDIDGKSPVGSDSDSGKVTADFGNDTPGTYEVKSASSVTFSGAQGNALTSGGDTVVITTSGNSYVGTANGETIFTLTLNQSTGAYEFKLLGQLDHADSTDPNDVITLNFGVRAVDSDNDTANGTITVKVYDDGPVAHDDYNTVDASVSLSTSGNVITGENGGAGAADNLSEDAANIITAVNGVDVSETGTTTINGTYGVLTIAADGSYTYTLKTSVVDNYAGSASTASFNPVSADTNGDHASITKNGITITGYDKNGSTSDLRWADAGAGAGIGVLGTGDNKVYPYGESLGITFDDAKSVTLSIGDLGGNDDDGDKGIDYVVHFADGTTASGEEGLASAGIVNGIYSFTIDSADYGDKEIVGVTITSTNAGSYGAASFVLSDVSVEFDDCGCLTDEFQYTLTDADGDSSQAILEICADIPADDQPTNLRTDIIAVDESDFAVAPLNQDIAYGNVTADFGNDGPGKFVVSSASSVTFSGAKGNALTSGGDPVVITTSGNSYVGKANGETIFTLTLNQSTGAYEFKLLGTLDHADTSSLTHNNDIITLNFGVQAVDSDNDTANGTITVKVYDDGPVAVNDTVSVDQLTSFSVSGNVTGNDTPSQDSPTVVSAVGSTAVSAGGTSITGTYGTLNIKADGSYTYTLKSASVDDVKEVFTYSYTDADGDTAKADLIIDVAGIPCEDDTPQDVTAKTLAVDETDIAGQSPAGSDSDNGKVTADFGNDGPGTYEVKGASSVTFSGADNSKLTSNGANIVITTSGNSYIGKANGETIFTLTLNKTTGEYVFTLLGQLDHADSKDPNDIITLNFGVEAVDADGDKADGTITVKVYDDGPKAFDDTGFIDQSKTLSVSGNVATNDKPGEDSPAVVSKVGDTNISANGTSIAGTYGTLNIKADGSYTYTLNASSTANKTEVFTYSYTDADGDTVQAKLTITAEGDDVPTGLTTETLIVDESDFAVAPKGQDSDGGQLSADFGNDGPGKFVVSSASSVTFSGAKGNALTSGGDPVVITTSGNSYVGKANGETIFTLTLNQSTGAYEFKLLGTLDHADTSSLTHNNDIITLNFGVKAVDADGDSANGTITVKVYDDGPVAHDDMASVDQLTSLSVSGNVTTNDVASQDSPTLVSAVGNKAVAANGTTDVAGTHGILHIKADGSYTYTLKSASVDDVKEVFTYSYTDADGDTAKADLIIDVAGIPCGCDDEPTDIKTNVLSVDETVLASASTHTVNDVMTANFGNDGPGKFVVGSASSVTFSGAKGNALTSGGDPVVITTSGNSYVGKANGETIFTLTLNQSTGAYEFKLLGTLDHADTSSLTHNNDIITLNFGVKAVDADGDSANGTIIVKVYDDGPVAVNDTASFDQSDKLSVSGNVTGNDTPSQDSPTVVSAVGSTAVSAGGTSIAGTYGTLNIKADGSYTYTLNAATNVTKTEVFEYSYKDADGDIATAKLTITAQPDDVPVAHNDVNNYASTDGTGNVITGANGGSGAADDLSDDGGNKITKIVFGSTTVNVPSSGTATIVGDHGTLNIKADGSYTYTPKNGGTDVFTYTLTDADGDKDTATLTVKVPTGTDLYDNALTLWGTQTTRTGNIFANDGPDADGSGLNPGLRVTSFSYNGHNYDVSNGGSKTINIDGGTLSISSNGAYTYTVSGANPSVDHASLLVINTIDNYGNTDTQDLSLSQLHYTYTSLGGGDYIIHFNGTSLDDALVGSNYHEDIHGNNGNDYILGDAASVNGTGGNDTIHGDTGNDFVQGYYGADSLYGDDGNDILFGDVSDTVAHMIDAVEHTGQQEHLNLMINNAASSTASYGSNDHLDGGAGNDYLFGGAGNDTLIGGSGNDILNGGSGNDTLTGGSGKDTFLFSNTGPSNADVITDFDINNDKLDISDILQGYDSLTDSLSDFVSTVVSGGDTKVYVDVNGDGAGQVLLVTLDDVSLTLNQLINGDTIVT